MKSFSQKLLFQMEAQLKIIHSQTSNPIIYAEQSVNIIIPIIETLKIFFLKYKFSDVIQEIEFFREIKPEFSHRLIFYNELYNIETRNNNISAKGSRKYYQEELLRLQKHFSENQEFYRYLRTGSNSLDKEYFVRGNYRLHFALDSACFQADSRFSTSHDYRLAQVMANEKIRAYLISKIKKTKVSTLAQPNTKIVWTGSNAALIELIYALHGEAVINNGKAELKEIVKVFEGTFNISLGQFNRTFIEIRDRKTDRTKFLTALKDQLLLRMDNADNR